MNRIRLALLALAVVLWTSLAGADPAGNIYWGTASSGKPAAVISNVFGVDNSGATDSGSAQVGAWLSLSRSGQTAFYSAGTYKDATQVYIGPNTLIQLGPNVTINEQLTAGAHAYPTTAWIYNVGTQAAGAGVVNTAPTLYTSLTLLVSSWAGAAPVVGQYANLAAAGSSTAGNATYLLTGVTNTGGGAYTLTVDRPFVWAFQVNDVVTVYSSVPRNIWIDGRGALGTGTGDQLVELARGRDVHIRGLNYNPSLGVVGSASSTGSVMGLDVGMISSSIEDCNADTTGMTPAGNYSSGFYMQSDERSVLRRLRVTGMPANAQAFSIMDSYSCGVEDSWAYGGSSSAAAVGFYSLTSASGFGGSRECWVRGGGAVGTGYGIIVQGGGTAATAALDSAISDWSGTGIVNDGIDIGTVNYAYGTKVSHVSATYCGGAGINVGADAGTDTQLKDVDVSHASGGGSHSTYGALHIAGTGVTVGVDGLSCDLASTEAEIGVYLTGGGQVALNHARISNAVAAGFGILQASASSSVTNSTITVSGHLPYGIYMAGTMYLENVSFVGPGDNSGTAIQVLSGGVVTLGPGISFGSGIGADLVVASGGIAYMVQSGKYSDATATGTVTMSVPQSQASVVVLTGSLSGNVAYNPPVHLVGTWNIDASGETLNGHTLSFGPSGGTVSLSAAQHIVYSDGTNAHTVL